MCTREEREGILWEFHRSGLSAAAACRTLRLFPTRSNLGRRLRLEREGELVAHEMPDRASRMRCAHGEGGAGEGNGMGGEGQTDWRDWSHDLPEDPAEHAGLAEVKLAEALAVLDVLKAPGPGSLTSREKFLVGQAVPSRIFRKLAHAAAAPPPPGLPPRLSAPRSSQLVHLLQPRHVKVPPLPPTRSRLCTSASRLRA